MKNLKIILVLTIQILMLNFLYTQTLVNNGAKIVTLSGTSLVIDGNYVNQLDGNIVNNGTLAITGDWTNNATSGTLMIGSFGEVKCKGSSVQNIGGTALTQFYDLLIESEVDVNTNTSVLHHLGLSNHIITANNADIKMEYGSTISGANPLAYVETLGSGRLAMVVENSDQTFNVGTATSYSPVTLNNNIGGSLDLYFVNVFPDVLDGGTSGSTVSEIDDCVNLSWNIEKLAPAVLDLSVTTQWNASDEGISFDRNNIGLGHYIMGSGWMPQEVTSATGTGPYTVTRSGITDLSAFAVGDLESPMAVPLAARLDLKVFLEGPYNDVANTMATNLYASGYIPLGQPYNPPTPYYGNPSPVWLYPGGESVVSIPADVVDWVIVQLRDATSPGAASSATILETQAAFVLYDGSIVALNGSSWLEFTISVVNDLYIVVYHRNHLGIISNFPPTLSGGVYTYDFSAGETQVYGGINGHKEIEPGIWAMVAADGDADGFVLPSDKTSVWLIDANLSGYRGGDFNMNGIGQPDDVTNFWLPNGNTAGQIPSKGETNGYQSQVPK